MRVSAVAPSSSLPLVPNTSSPFPFYTGEITSSRRAAAALNHLNIPFTPVTEPFDAPSPPPPPPRPTPLSTLITSLSNHTRQPPSNVFLTPSGMQSIHAALRLSRAIRRNAHQTPGTAVVFGFPYLDTLKMCGRKELSDGVDFLGFGDDRDINMFKFICEQRRANDGEEQRSERRAKDGGMTKGARERRENKKTIRKLPEVL